MLGIDIGTQGVRCVALDEERRVVAGGGAPLATETPRDGWAVQRAEAIWTSVQAAVGDVVQGLGSQAKHIRAIGLDATASLLVADAEGRPMTDVILWMDVRAEKEAKLIGGLTGRVESAELPWAKAVWLSRHQADVFKPDHRLFEVADWIIWRMTGQVTRSQASAVLKWYGTAPQYLPEWANLFAGLRQALPRRLVRAGEVAGILLPEVADAFGLARDVCVAGPIIDAYAGAVGSGALKVGTMALILGSSNCELFHGCRLVATAGLWGPFKDIYGLELDVLEAGQPSTGAVARWVEHTMGQGLSLSELDGLAAELPPGADGVKCFPAFQGVRSPWPDAAARGKIHGLSLHHRPAHLLRAVYEGTAFEIRRTMDAVQMTDLHRIVACGGGIQSRVWLSIIGDICDLPLEIADNEAVPRGAALLAAMAIGHIDSLAAFGAAWPALGPTMHSHAYHALYREYTAEFPLNKVAPTAGEPTDPNHA